MFHLILAAAAVQSTTPVPFRIALICEGDGMQIHPVTKPFHDTARIDIDGETGRLRLPQGLEFPIHKTDELWLTLQNIAVSPDSILARVIGKLLYRGKISIDRVTGSISLDTYGGNFSGRCQRFDPAKVEHAF